MSEITVPEETPHVHVHTAFLVIVDGNGKATALLDEVPDHILTDVRADPRMVKAACVEVADSIQADQTAQMTAGYVAQGLNQMLDAIAPLLVPPTPPTPYERVQERLKSREG